MAPAGGTPAVRSPGEGVIGRLNRTINDTVRVKVAERSNAKRKQSGN